jgi:hypothetical protein
MAAELREVRINVVRNSLMPCWETLCAHSEEFASTLFRRMYAVSPKTAELFPFSKDESVKCIVSMLLAFCVRAVGALA